MEENTTINNLNINESVASLEKKLEVYESKRQAAKKKARMYYLILIPVAILVAVYGAMNYPPLILGGFVIWFISVGISQKGTTKISKELKDILITKIVRETFPDCTYSMETGIDLREVMATNMLHRPARYFSEDMISSTYKNIPFVVSDIKLQDKHTSTDKNGHKKTTYTTYFLGKIIKIDLLRDLDLTLKIYEKTTFSLFSGSDKKLNKVETESIAFNKKFNTFSSTEQDAFYVLTPQIQEKIMSLESKFTGTMHFCFKNGVFYCLINDSVNGLEVDINKSIDLEWYKSIISELNLTPSIIDEFRFDSDKWVNNNR